MHEKENDYGAVCPQCGADAMCLLSPDKSRVEVECPDCGRYEMSREEFDLALTERIGVEEPER